MEHDMQEIEDIAKEINFDLADYKGTKTDKEKIKEYEEFNYNIKCRDFKTALSALLTRHDEIENEQLGKLMYEVMEDILYSDNAKEIAKAILKESAK